LDPKKEVTEMAKQVPESNVTEADVAAQQANTDGGTLTPGTQEGVASTKRSAPKPAAEDPLVSVSRRYHETESAINSRVKRLDVARRQVAALEADIDRLENTKSDIRKQMADLSKGDKK
jgi:septal ring factor EnvC (AmiA/AmiB activator)